MKTKIYTLKHVSYFLRNAIARSFFRQIKRIDSAYFRKGLRAKNEKNTIIYVNLYEFICDNRIRYSGICIPCVKLYETPLCGLRSVTIHRYLHILGSLAVFSEK